MAASFYLGAARSVSGKSGAERLMLPAHHLVTHGVVVGTTGSGKTGLLTVMVEEALKSQVPVLIIDVKGDLPNLLLSFPSFSPDALLPWVEGAAPPSDPRSVRHIARELAALREQGLNNWGVTEEELQDFHTSTSVRVITPGSSAGELLHMLSGLEMALERWRVDPERARDSLGTAISLLLRLIGRDSDPAKSREHVLLTVLAHQRLRAGQPTDLEALIEDIINPPMVKIGALTVDAFFSKSDRKSLAAAINSLLASPSFAQWREGTTLDIGSWLTRVNGRTPAVIVSVAHLSDEERTLVLGVLLEEVLTWVRSLPGTQRLKALFVFDEIYGFLPPYPANPATKRPLVSLMKQARAFGVGVLVATQNPMDLDYRALGNAGLWCLGRLQTDADRKRVLEGIASSGNGFAHKQSELDHLVKRLSPRWFLMRDSHSPAGLILLQPRWTMSYLRGPMTKNEIRKARGVAVGS